jgi:hypothetical protein
VSIDDICSAYEESTDHFLDAVASVSDDHLDRRLPGGWSARQVIHHMADAEAQSYARLRRLVAEPAGSIIQAYDEGAWAENETLGYATLPVEHSLDVVRSVRRASLDILRRLSTSDLDHYGEHTESGHYTMNTWIEIYTDHARVHAAQLLEAASSPSD